MNEQQLIDSNPDLNWIQTGSKKFQTMGRILDGLDFSKSLEILKKETLPDEVSYQMNVPEIEEIEKNNLKPLIESKIYAEFPCQIGWCIGRNRQLNALEWHQGSEVLYAGTDQILLLGDFRDLKEGKLNRNQIYAVYLNSGTAVELYGGTLHFAPVETSKNGFRSLIILPKQTNDELSDPEIRKTDPLIWKKNKWLTAHPQSPQAEQGAFTGLKGGKITLVYTDHA